MKCAIFKNLSTATKIKSVVRCVLGRPKIKSMDSSSQGVKPLRVNHKTLVLLAKKQTMRGGGGGGEIGLLYLMIN